MNLSKSMQLQNDLITLLGQVFRTIDFILTEPNIYHKKTLNFGSDADIIYIINYNNINLVLSH